MGLGEAAVGLLRRIAVRRASGITAMPVREVDPVGDGEATVFRANEVYLEVRVRQLWLANQRVLWREYAPFSALVTEVLHQGERVAIPAVLGPDELRKRLSLVGEADGLEIRNVRVAGPVPYEGDDVALLLTLFRSTTVDWLARTIGIVEDVASAVGAAGLVTAAPVATALLRAVDSLTDADGMDLRVGEYRSWPSDELRPMSYALIAAPEVESGPELVVRDGRLCRADTGARFVDHDFLLVGVSARRFRDDYRQLEFYPLWQETQRHLVDGEFSAAQRCFRRMVGALYTDQLTIPQQETLLREYEARYAERLAVLGPSPDRDAHIDLEFDVSSGLPIDDEDPVEILRRSLDKAT